MIESSNLCSSQQLIGELGTTILRVVDASWYMPAEKIDTYDAYIREHVPGAVYFDIDQVCDKSSELPHMLPSAEVFSDTVGALGISNNDQVVIYDTAGLFSAARVWWMFKVFGHDKVSVLNGGLPAWVAAGGETTSAATLLPEQVYLGRLNSNLLADRSTLLNNCEQAECIVLDARSKGRYLGSDPEPRPGLPSGHMPHSKSLPFDSLIEHGQLKSVDELQRIFTSLGVDQNSNVITSCGSGVTASIITLALSESGNGMQRLYDGSWSEWASSENARVLTGE